MNKLELIEKVIKDKNPYTIGMDVDRYIGFHDGFVEGFMIVFDYMKRRYPTYCTEIQNDVLKELSKDYENK